MEKITFSPLYGAEQKGLKVASVFFLLQVLVTREANLSQSQSSSFSDNDFSVCVMQCAARENFVSHEVILYAEVSWNISDVYLVHVFYFQVYIKGYAVKAHIIYAVIHSRKNEKRLTFEIFMTFSICIHHQMYF